jgi:glycosyltransferase involved in cell wall biosynthesis
MRIAINTRFLLSHKMEGFGWFTYEVVKRLVEKHPEHDFFFFFDRKYDSKFIFGDNVTPVILNPPARHPILFKIWFNFSVTRALKKYKIDLFFSPDGYLSLKTDVKQVGVIHDLNFEHYPEDIPASPRKYLKTYFPLFAKKANKIITVSEFSKQDIVKQYGISPEKITVAHNGGNESFKPLSDTEQNKVKQKYSNGTDYFVYVGALHARKNTDRLFQAFDQFKKDSKSDLKLIVVGEKLWKSDQENTSFNNLDFKDDIIFTGHLKIEELIQIVAAARALTLVSYFEGFGIPLVEAMRCGTPIISSNRTALPEVAGDCGLLVDPFDINDISKAMTTLIEDSSLQSEMSQKGLERSKLFSWDQSADIIWQEINKLLSSKN